MFRTCLQVALFAVWLGTGLVAHGAPLTTVSPDGRISIEIFGEPLSYSVRFGDRTVLKDSHLGLRMRGEAPWGPANVSTVNHANTDVMWTPVWGKTARVRNQYNETQYLVKENGGTRRELGLVVRAYNDGVAFRYVVNRPGGEFTLEHEDTTFQFPGDTEVWAGTTKSYHHAYEQEYPHAKLEALTPGSHVVLPLLARTGSLYAAITEADLTDWAGMYLNPNGRGFGVDLSPRLDGNGLVHAIAPHASPWRVILLSERVGAFIESNMIENLNPPSKITDTSWIKPGVSAWDHWWSGGVKMTNDEEMRFIQLASDMGWAYQLIDWQWYGKFNSPDADIARPAPQIDMPLLLRFAKQHGVREWLWIHSADVDRFKRAGKLDGAFATYEKWGIAGVKIDFMESNDQDMVNWYTDVVALAAKHHLMVDFHGAFVPTGLRVTWPNLLTREAVMGNEYFQFSERMTPTHKMTLPFTRMIAGPMDYTPGGFRNRSPKEWKRTNPTEVIGSRSQELALFVVYYSPFMCASDDPDNYRGQPGVDFLKVVPTVWDDTRVLDGSVGENIVIARRKGAAWFVGGITGDKPLDYTLDFKFLGEGRFTAHIYADPADPTASYEAMDVGSRVVTKDTKVQLPMRQAGGFAIYLEPVRRGRR